MRKIIAAFTAATVLASAAQREPAAQPQSGFGALDHVFLIVMENQTSTDITRNPNAPFINAYAKVANHATNYSAVGHPSAPNYLELVGGSNFGVSSDFWPNWVGAGCIDNAPGSTGCADAATPIAVAGIDNAVVATATNSAQCNGQITISGARVPHNFALYNYPAKFFTPSSIADQLVVKHKSWKTYQESLPIIDPGAFGVNYSDGSFSNLSPPSVFAPGPVQKLYAVKHDPFVYFQNIETGDADELSLEQVKDIEGPDGLWVDRDSHAPNLSFIVPNQCHDMHGFVSGGTPICSAATPAESALLMLQGDAEVAKPVQGI